MSTPEDANDGCVGPSSDTAGKASACAGCPNQSACASGANKAVVDDPAIALVKERMAQIKHKVLVLSGKGGVGKSTVSAQLAFALAAKGFSVGLLDVDICGPSIPQMLGIVGREVHQSASGWSPVYVEDNLGVMSVAFMLPNQDDAVIWRGPRKNGLIKQFLSDVDWGEMDYLIIDTPPGTSDEHISIVQYLKEATVDGAVVVTTPQEVAMADVRKELNFCKKTSIKVLGVVENMAEISFSLRDVLEGRVKEVKLVDTATSAPLDTTALQSLVAQCPQLAELSLTSSLYNSREEGTNNPERMAEQFQVPYLGRLPMDPNLTKACESGQSFMEAFEGSTGAAAFGGIVDKVVAACNA